MSTTGSENHLGTWVTVVLTFVAVLGGIVFGHSLGTWASTTVHSKYFPWISARSLGLGAVAVLVAATLTGYLVQHPWRSTLHLPSPATMLRIHAALSISAFLLVIGHIVALVLDPYAGTSLKSAFVPFTGTYRSFYSGLGTISFDVMLIVLLTMLVAYTLPVFAKAWRGVHYVVLGITLLALAHGLLTGTDSPKFTVVYVLAAIAVVFLAVPHYLYQHRLRVQQHITEGGR